MTGGQAAGAALGGAAMFAVFGAIWVTFAGLGGSDAYRQTFVEDVVTDLTIVSLHTDDEQEEADAARRALKSRDSVQVLEVDRSRRRRPVAG